MRNSFFGLSLLLIGICHAQNTSKEIEIRNKLWGDTQPAFQAIDFPEKWVDEPAVILAVSSDLGYKKIALSNRLYEYSHYHERTKILSQQALEKYAQFSFSESKVSFSNEDLWFVGFKIIKLDGRVIEIPLSEAVREEIKTKNSTSYAMLKLAIPNLEIGDIIDYYIAHERTYLTTKFHSFDPVIFQLRRKYATVYGRLSFDVMRRCFINFKTYNGAPTFTYVQDLVSDDDRYLLEYGDQEKIEDLPFFYPYRSLPTVKFKVTYASPTTAYQYPSLIDAERPGILKSKVSINELKTLLAKYESFMFDATGLWKYMRKNYPHETSKVKLAQEAFLYERNQLAVKYAESRAIYQGETPSASSFQMVNNLGEYFKKAKIDYDLILGVPKSIGSIDDIILEEELVVGIKTRTNPPVYITRFGSNSLPGDINEMLSQSKVYISDLSVLTSGWKFVEYNMPGSSSEDNLELVSLNVNVDLTNLSTEIFAAKRMTGFAKLDEQNSFMDGFDYIDEERAKYNMPPLGSQMLSADLRNLMIKKSEFLSSRDSKREEKLKGLTEDRLNIKLDTLHSFEVKEKGRSLSDSSFSYEYITSTKELLHKVGDNYLFDIGLLIEQQVHVAKEFKTDREFDVFMNYPRKFDHIIKLKIPDGFEVQGLEKLNYSVSNQTGGFETKATVENQELLVEVSKFYSNAMEPAANWNEMLKFIDAADDFNSVKVLLRKINP